MKSGEQGEKPFTILHIGTLSLRAADAATKHVVASIRILKSRIVKVCKNRCDVGRRNAPGSLMSRHALYYKKSSQALTTL